MTFKSAIYKRQLNGYKLLKKKSSKLRNLKERADGVLGQFGDLLDVDVDVEASGEINT